MIGGHTQMSNGRSIPSIYVVTFETNTRLVDEIDLSSNGSYAGAALTVRRFVAKNVFLVGGNKFAMVVEWTGSHLCILNIVDDVHSGRNFLPQVRSLA